jgi:hypothetical protein
MFDRRRRAEEKWCVENMKNFKYQAPKSVFGTGMELNSQK